MEDAIAVEEEHIFDRPSAKRLREALIASARGGKGTRRIELHRRNPKASCKRGASVGRSRIGIDYWKPGSLDRLEAKLQELPFVAADYDGTNLLHL